MLQILVSEQSRPFRPAHGYIDIHDYGFDMIRILGAGPCTFSDSVCISRKPSLVTFLLKTSSRAPHIDPISIEPGHRSLCSFGGDILRKPSLLAFSSLPKPNEGCWRPVKLVEVARAVVAYDLAFAQEVCRKVVLLEDLTSRGTIFVDQWSCLSQGLSEASKLPRRYGIANGPSANLPYSRELAKRIKASSIAISALPRT